MSAPEETGRLDRGDGVELAWRRGAGRGPGVVFLGGFNSDMTGSKAEALSAFCAARGPGLPALRLFRPRRRAAGASWTAPSAAGRRTRPACFDALTEGPQVLVGSSMGGWIALLLALRRPERVAALVGIAAAPDFTARIAEPCRPRRARRSSATASGTGRATTATPTPITRALLEDGRAHLLLRGAADPDRRPVRLLHGQRDPDVPWQPVAAHRRGHRRRRTCR